MYNYFQMEKKEQATALLGGAHGLNGSAGLNPLSASQTVRPINMIYLFGDLVCILRCCHPGG